MNSCQVQSSRRELVGADELDEVEISKTEQTQS
jgi:hypothetical protein